MNLCKYPVFAGAKVLTFFGLNNVPAPTIYTKDANGNMVTIVPGANTATSGTAGASDTGTGTGTGTGGTGTGGSGGGTGSTPTNPSGIGTTLDELRSKLKIKLH